MTNRERRIREIAYHLWEQEGRPEGESHSHRLWLAAEAQFEAEIAGSTDGDAAGDASAGGKPAKARKRKADEPEWPGVSVFYKDRDGNIYHTYSAYARGIDILNTAYHYLDLLPKGRDEAELEYPQAWVHYHDKYDE